MGDAEPELGDLLTDATRQLRRRWAGALEPAGLVPHQFRVLRLLHAEGGLRNGELAARLRIAPRSVTEVVDGLVGKELVTRKPDPQDRRAAVVTLTPAGEGLLELATEQRRAESERHFAALTEHEQEILRDLLSKITHSPDGQILRSR